MNSVARMFRAARRKGQTSPDSDEDPPAVQVPTRPSQSFCAADAAAPASELKAKMDRHGHVLFRGLLPLGRIFEARAEALQICQEVGWIRSAQDPLEARWIGGRPTPADDTAEWAGFYRRWVKAPSFNALPEDPALTAVTEKLLGGPVLVHPRKIGRIGFPQNEGHQTPVHQDYFHIRGTPETYTAWIPLGPCPKQLGSLTVADGSHRFGFRDHQPSAGPGGFAVDPGGEVTWRAEDFAAGDVLIFHSLTMHKALPNRSQDEIRISLDNRYQRASDEVDPSSLQPHS